MNVKENLQARIAEAYAEELSRGLPVPRAYETHYDGTGAQLYAKDGVTLRVCGVNEYHISLEINSLIRGRFIEPADAGDLVYQLQKALEIVELGKIAKIEMDMAER